MEDSLAKAAKSRYGAEYDIRAHIDRSSGVISLARYTEIVAGAADLENEVIQIFFLIY